MATKSPMALTGLGAPIYLCPATSLASNGVSGAPNPVQRVLIANRGEIALRIIQTCAALGISTVAVYVSEDRDGPHVKAANHAICLGSIEEAAASGRPQPYLDGKLLIQTAVEAGCDALHPGYGFLSEQADFADQVAATPVPGSASGQLVFIGPKGEVMRQMGDKANSKILLKARMGIDRAPLVPGYESEQTSQGQDVDVLVEESKKIGFPVLIKASAGGGGKGMRIVRDATSLPDEISRAQSESQRSFGSAHLLIEKYIENGKHIEVQIMGDAHGNVIAIGERECSVQRRHQKIIEESPCTEMSRFPELRRQLHASAVEIGKLLAYQGAATIEYIYSPKDRQFFFLEINTRLQVEHPITEMVHGIDLVSLQLYIAGGGDLTLLDEVTSRASAAAVQGHAIELRLCAEEPGAEFAPRIGFVRNMAFPLAHRPGFRLDSGITTGSEVSIHFDPMLAKLIVHGTDRRAAIIAARQMLETTPVLGVVTNTAFLHACLRHPTFEDGSYSTSLIPENLDQLLQSTVSIGRSALCGPEAELPVQAMTAAFVFFYTLRKQLRPNRQGLRASWRAHPADVAASFQTEQYNIALPDGGGSWQVILQYRPAPKTSASSQDRFELRMWANEAADATQKAVLKQMTEKAKKKDSAGKAVPTFLHQRTAATARFYSSLPSRTGIEGRPTGEEAAAAAAKKKRSPPTNFGVPHEKIWTTTVDSRDTQLSWQRAISGNVEWVNGALRYESTRAVSLSDSEDTETCKSSHLAIVASDENWTTQAAEEAGQSAWIWLPAIAGQVKVTRKTIRVYAGRLDEGGVAGGNDDSTYSTPMPCRILQLLAKQGQTVKAGDGILVMESMKTEIRLLARSSGVLQLLVKEGDTIGEGQNLCIVEPVAE